MSEIKMTEQQFIAKFKKSGFELYKTSEIKKKYKRLELFENKSAQVK